MNAPVRVFAALELPAPVRQRLAETMAALQAATPRGSVRWVRLEGLHLTLQFYGDVEAARLPDLQAALARTAAVGPALTLTLGGLGVFPDAARPRVVWVGLTGDLRPLGHLQRAVQAASEPLGFPPEARSFQPHLTLGRVNQPLRPADQARLAEALARTPPPQALTFGVAALSLMRSDLRPGGAVYTPVSVSPLGGRKE